MTFRPLHDRVAVRRLDQEEKTRGGIIIPDSAKEKPAEGEVVAVGNGKVLEGGQVRPLDVKVGDRILVKRVQEEERTRGGIIIPDSAKEKPVEGEVVAVGNGKVTEQGKLQPLAVKKGDRILFGKYSGTEIKVDGVEHLILREEEVLGIIEK